MRLKSVLIFIITIALCVPAASSCRRAHLRGEQPAQRERGGQHTQRAHRGMERSIEMHNEGGVYYVPVNINGVDMEFIFDTGASIVSLSMVEAAFLYKQGKLSNDDIVGEGQFVDATGRVSTSAIINLRDVTIGGITIHDVQASVNENQEAPLLLGQTVLSRFGTVTIDYDHNRIILKN